MSLRQRGLTISLIAFGFAALVFLVTLLHIALTVDEAVAQSSSTQSSSSVRPPEGAVVNARPPAPPPTNAPMQPGQGRPLDAVTPPNPGGAGPLSTLGANSDATLWGEVRHGSNFTVTIPDRKAARLVQTTGMPWEAFRGARGPIYNYGTKAVLGMIALLALFFLLRGRVRIEKGFSGTLIERFKPIERFAHWMLAVSFILLAITGLNLFYGRALLIPLLGKQTYAEVTLWGKYIHNNVAWAFMISLAMVIVMWLAHNIPSREDLVWLAQGGGLFSKKLHPPSRKFNAGQKIIFWAVVLLGLSVSASGISLLFPFDVPMFAKTFAVLNKMGGGLVWGAPLPTQLSPIQEMQLAELWHTMVAFAMVVVILAHIYIGTLGMEGAFDAMGTGMVDRNWAEEHHSLWVEEEDAKAAKPDRDGAAATPAE